MEGRPRRGLTIDSDKDVRALRQIGRIVADCLQVMAQSMEPGMSTAQLDAIGADFLASHSARSAPILVYDFPGATCISIAPDAAHGIPGERVLKPGDLVNIDVSAELGGYFADTGGSFSVPPVHPSHQRLCDATLEALQRAMAEARHGARLNRIGHAIEQTAKDHGFGVIRNLGSHGVGRTLHEDPTFIPGFYKWMERRKLREGMVITIEPFLTTGKSMVQELEDGWTLRTQGGFSAQYEHTMIITRDAPIILTEPSPT